jgi:hypothetical protein
VVEQALPDASDVDRVLFGLSSFSNQFAIVAWFGAYKDIIAVRKPPNSDACRVSASGLARIPKESGFNHLVQCVVGSIPTAPTSFLLHW